MKKYLDVLVAEAILMLILDLKVTVVFVIFVKWSMRFLLGFNVYLFYLIKGTDNHGIRNDKFEKPELHRGVYEFVVP